ncbi:MAG: hypothetical protein PHR90_09305 [Sphaerochaetaceae bacterium]|jgi:hypothetical protein|nr:hypothetical protein [Sphaerochaetaceae bacterium]MDD3942655.1 hypothetical protein [Sphaerochaetaceae bacterium]MDX9938832.1 hypothetical protein [Sphaerochaetaceae bacterium]
MKKGPYLKIAYIAVHGILSVILLYFSIMVLLRQMIPNILQARTAEGSETARFLVPMMFHILFTFVGMIPSLRLPDTSRNEIERNLLPLTFFSFTVMDISIVASYVSMRGQGSMDFSFIGRLHLFAMLFGMTLLLLMGLFHIGINTGKLWQFTLLTAAGALLIASSVPLSVALYPKDPSLWYADRQFLILPWALGILSSFTHLSLYIRERTQHNLFRTISFTCISVGNLLFIGRSGTFSVWVGILLLAAGIVMGIPRDGFSQLE